MHSIKFNGKVYEYEPKCSGMTFQQELMVADYQLLGVVVDNLHPSVIGVVYSQYEGNPAWLPMKWDLYTGKHYDGGFNITPIKNEGN